MQKIPTNIHHLFWDINIETFEPHDYPRYTISRVLEFGDEAATRWLKEVFSESEIKSVLRADNRLSPRSANFWAIMFGIPLNEIAALKSNEGSAV